MENPGSYRKCRLKKESKFMNPTRRRRICLVFSLSLVAATSLSAATDLAVTTKPVGESDLTLSKCIPVKGKEIELRAKVRNAGKDPARNVSVAFSVTLPEGKVVNVGSDIVNVEAGNATQASVKWTPGGTGFYKFSVRVDPDNRIAESDKKNNTATWDFPVVFRELYFNKWGSNIKNLRYLTMSSTTDDSLLQYWNRRGSIRLKWYGGKLDLKEDEEAQRKRYIENLDKILAEGYDGIIIDEIGSYPGPEARELARRWSAILLAMRKKYPKMQLWIWNAGSLLPDMASAYRNAKAIVLLECYENWVTKAFHTHSFYDYFDQRISMSRHTDSIDLVGSSVASIMCLGVGPNHGGMAKEQIEDQVRYIKRHGPEMPGISFWGGNDKWSEALGGLDEFLDQLCLKYYIMPVVTIRPEWIWPSSYDPRAGQEVAVRIRVHNIGGMEARDVKVRLFARDLDTRQRRLIGQAKIPQIGCGSVEVKRSKPFKGTKEKHTPDIEWRDVHGISVPLGDLPASVQMNRRIVEMKWNPEKAGHYSLEVQIEPSKKFTLLDGYAEKQIVVQP